MALKNMGRQYRELRRRLEDAERLRLYAKAATSAPGIQKFPRQDLVLVPIFGTEGQGGL